MAINNDALVDVNRLSRYHAGMKAKFLDKKVDVEDGKRLMADTEGTKLAGIADGAQVNVIESVAVKDENIVTVTDKGVQIDLSAYAKAADVATAYRPKGTKANYSDLPTEGNVIGDVWNITNADKANGVKAGDNVVFTEDGWDILAGITDLSDYVTKETGKGLSTEDFSTALKTKLEGITVASDGDIDGIFGTDGE